MRKARFIEALIFMLLILAGAWGILQLEQGRITAKLDPVAMASTANPSPASPGYWTNVIYIPASFTTGTSYTNYIKFKAPWPATLIGFQAIARTSGAGALTANLKEGATTVLSTPVSMNTTTVTEATISDAAIADEATMTIDLAATGTGTWTNPTLQLIWKRK